MTVQTETWDYNPLTRQYDTVPSWACPRQLTSHWGCPTILDRVIENFGVPDVCFGKTDGIPENVDTVDVNPESKAKIIAPWDNIPVPDRHWNYGFWDPPYDKRYEKELKEILRTLSNRIIILHQIVYPNPVGWHKIAIIGVTTGPNMRIRALQVYERDATPLTRWMDA